MVRDGGHASVRLFRQMRCGCSIGMNQGECVGEYDHLFQVAKVVAPKKAKLAEAEATLQSVMVGLAAKQQELQVGGQHSAVIFAPVRREGDMSVMHAAEPTCSPCLSNRTGVGCAILQTLPPAQGCATHAANLLPAPWFLLSPHPPTPRAHHPLLWFVRC